MNENIIVKWLIFFVVMMALVLVGLIAYAKGWIGEKQENRLDAGEKYIVTPGTPESRMTKVSNISLPSSTAYTKGTFMKITDLGVTILYGMPDSSKPEITWNYNSETTVGCTDDLYTDADGKIARRSEQYINYQNLDAMLTPQSEKLEWLIKNAKVGQPIIIFGDKEEMLAKTIYLYIDKCL